MAKTLFLEKPETLVGIALGRASKKTASLKDRGKRNRKRAVFFSNYLIERIDRAIAGMPSGESMNAFHFELLKTIESEEKIWKMRSHFLAVRRLLLQRKWFALKKVRSKSRNAKAFSELIGRSRSIMESLDQTITQFNSLQRKLRELPKIDFKAKTLILAGFPNAGKTTILKRLTGSSPEIASYPFTTKKLNIGYFEWKHRSIQVIDTPGLLDRELEERNAIERRAILALKHLTGLVGLVIDCSGQIGLKEQRALLESIKNAFSGKELVVFLNKIDISTEKGVKKAGELFSPEETIEFPEGKSREVREILGQKLF